MLFTESTVKIADNSGGVYVRCIKVPGSSKPRFARFADEIVVSTRVIKPKHNVKASKQILKGQVHKAVLIRTKKPVFFPDYGGVRFFNNAAVLIKKSQPRTFGGPKLAGNRVFGPVVQNKKLKKKYPKIFSLASRVIR
jgi:large subunit ribosomal protein L14